MTLNLLDDRDVARVVRVDAVLRQRGEELAAA
jgi:hypothetical protein